jgi:hypothetical protein
MLETQMSAGTPGLGLAIIDLACRIQQLENALCRRQSALHELAHAAQPLQRSRQHQHGGHKRQETAHRGCIALGLNDRQIDDNRQRDGSLPRGGSAASR